MSLSQAVIRTNQPNVQSNGASLGCEIVESKQTLHSTSNPTRTWYSLTAGIHGLTPCCKVSPHHFFHFKWGGTFSPSRNWGRCELGGPARKKISGGTVVVFPERNGGRNYFLFGREGGRELVWSITCWSLCRISLEALTGKCSPLMRTAAMILWGYKYCIHILYIEKTSWKWT